MKVSRIALLLAAAAVLEFFVGRSPYRTFVPVDWFLLVTATVSRSGDFVRAVLTGAVAGSLEDAASPLIGLNAFAKAVIGYALTLVSVRVAFGGALAVGAALFVASLANEALVALLAALLVQSPVVILTRDAFWRAAATGIAGGALESAWNFPWRDWWQRRRLRRLR
ncbi:MAG TPA: rod shape-determining protein MreD [Thermoanaerobaculia bacterium]